MVFLTIVGAACFLLHTWLHERVKRRVSYSINIQERTEEAETLSFSVNLFEDESMGSWSEKLERAYSIAEARRAFNNNRMMAEYDRIQKQAADAKKEESSITAFKK